MQNASKVQATGYTRKTRDGQWRSTVAYDGAEYVGPVMATPITAEHAALHAFVREIRPAAINLHRVLDFTVCACSAAEVNS